MQNMAAFLQVTLIYFSLIDCKFAHTLSAYPPLTSTVCFFPTVLYVRTMGNHHLAMMSFNSIACELYMCLCEMSFSIINPMQLDNLFIQETNIIMKAVK